MNLVAQAAPETAEAALGRMARAAKDAAQALALASGAARDAALREGAGAIRAQRAAIEAANERDMAAARAAGQSSAFLDRLALDPARIEAMARGLEDIAALPDPLGRVLADWTRPNGLRIRRIAVPIGVIGVIYESRPNVTADAGALCLKAGNAVILRGGSDSHHSAQAIHAALAAGLRAAGLPEAAIQVAPTAERAFVGAMLAGHGLIDLIVPRGGKSLVGRVLTESRVATLGHYEGRCHTYVHAAADPAMARAVVLNAKLRRTGVCGATETLLIDRAIAPALLPQIVADLAAKGCTFRACPEARAILPGLPAAGPEDFDTEWLDAILSVKLVGGVAEAVAHVNRHGSEHTDAIITADTKAAEAFLAGVNSAIALHNASTQFADGGEFGFGAEIGIATGKLHARGPVGVEQLTTMKYLVRGSGQVRP
ncbi:MAG: glutamate-5-semialdehyde dehydrogenase [Alphaproteobacteria bacterium]|nr:glutamate-5-semialdehyde dehydrogenase [Alphaproteobacteria bacterium]